MNTDNNILSDTMEDQPIRSALEKGDLSSAVETVKDILECIENIQLNIAVTGETGAGKSTLINVFRGLNDEDDGSAETGVIETTKNPTAYPHPHYKNVKYWDLPGIGSPNFKSEDYLQEVKFDRYDFFIIVASERFKNSNLKLALAIQDMGKKFYFVRSKIDADINASKKKRPKTFNEQDILQKIRKDCFDCFSKVDLKDPQVFLIDCLDKRFDFELLQDVLEKSLPSHKRHTFLLSLPNISMSVLQKKKEMLRKQIWKRAFLSCTVAAIPIPGLGIACDIAILVKYMREYQKVFGLDEQSLCRLSQSSGKSITDLKSAIKSPQVIKEINKEIVIKMLTKGMMGAVMLAEYAVSNIPVLGSLAAGSLSFVTTYKMLHSFLNEALEDAQRVFIKASEDPV